MTQRASDIVLCIVLIAFSAVMYMFSYHFAGFQLERDTADIGPKFVPRVTLFLLALSSTSLIYFRMRSKEKEESPLVSFFSRRLVLTLCGFIFYIALTMMVGFCISTIFFILVSFLVLGVRKFWILLLIPPALTAIIYYVFEKLNVWLPRGLAF
jgi:hypothetical protein